MKKLVKRLTVLSAFLLTACSTFQKTNLSTQVVDEKKALEAYARVLQNFVNSAGEVDFEGIKKEPLDLETFVNYVSQKRFSDLTTPESLLAHHLNAYNALSMFTVVQKGIPKTNAGFSKVRFFYLTKMDIGGKEMSLVTYENDYIRSIGEDRVHWALNCMAVSCPRLPQKPFTAKTLNQDLQTLAVLFFNSEKNVQVDEKNKIVHVSEILKFFPKDFVPKKAATIIDYINLYRDKKISADIATEYIPYDWTVNNSNNRRH